MNYCLCYSLKAYFFSVSRIYTVLYIVRLVVNMLQVPTRLMLQHLYYSSCPQ